MTKYRECECCGQPLHLIEHWEDDGENGAQEFYYECPNECSYPTETTQSLEGDELECRNKDLERLGIEEEEEEEGWRETTEEETAVEICANQYAKIWANTSLPEKQLSHILKNFYYFCKNAEVKKETPEMPELKAIKNDFDELFKPTLDSIKKSAKIK